MEVQDDSLIGRFYVRVLRARNLAAKDATGFSDPYVRVSLGTREYLRTKTQPQTLDPTWNEEITINIDSPFETLNIEVWDEDVGSGSEFMGYLSFRIAEFADQKLWQAWFPLKKQSVSQQVSGDIELQLHLIYHAKYQSTFLGASALYKQNYGPSVRLLTQAIESMPTSPFLIDLYNLRSSALLGMQRLKEGLQDAAAALKLNRNSAQAWYNMGLIYFAAEDYVQAKQAFERGVTAAPNDQRCAQALKDLERNAVAQNIRKHIADAREKFRIKKYAEAAEVITKVPIELNPQNHVYYWYRSLAYMGAGELEKAEEDILTVLRFEPDWPKQNPTRQGELKKQGDINIMFQRRWFIMKDNYLFYYKNSEDLEPKGVILLHKVLSELKKEELYIKGRKRVYRVKANTSEQMAEWHRDIDRVARAELTLPVDKNEKKVFLEGEKQQQEEARKRRFTLFGNVTKMMAGKMQVAASNITKEGWLHKQGEVNKSWQKRYFVLKGESFYYFKQKPEVTEGVYAGTQGVIQLSGSSLQDISDPTASYAFQIRPFEGSRVYVLHADTQPEFNEWKSVLQAAIKAGKQQVEEHGGGADFVIGNGGGDSSTRDSPDASKVRARRASVRVSQEDMQHIQDEIKKEQNNMNNGNSVKRNSGENNRSSLNNSTLSKSTTNDGTGNGGSDNKRNTNEGDGSGSQRSIHQWEVSKSEQRYFQKFGLEAPADSQDEEVGGQHGSQKYNQPPPNKEGRYKMKSPNDNEDAEEGDSLLGANSANRGEYDDGQSKGGCCSGGCNIL